MSTEQVPAARGEILIALSHMHGEPSPILDHLAEFVASGRFAEEFRSLVDHHLYKVIL